MFAVEGLRQALQTLGVILAERGLAYEVVAVGGGGLLFAQFVDAVVGHIGGSVGAR